MLEMPKTFKRRNSRARFENVHLRLVPTGEFSLAIAANDMLVRVNESHREFEHLSRITDDAKVASRGAASNDLFGRVATVTHRMVKRNSFRP
jgi:hypothetical protein